jgi:hypothetical protein
MAAIQLGDLSNILRIPPQQYTVTHGCNSTRSTGSLKLEVELGKSIAILGNFPN